VPRLAHFATVSGGGRPRVRPLWYAYEDGVFYFTTRLQARYTGADLTAGSSVAVSIGSEDRPYRAVLAPGPAEVWSGDRQRSLERPSGWFLRTIRLAGGTFLVFIAASTVLEARRDGAGAEQRPRLPPFGRGILAVLINPGALIFLATSASALLAGAEAAGGRGF